MLDWISDNRAWIFDGIGAIAITSLIGIIFKRKNNSGAIYQKGGRGSTNLQAGRDLNINRELKENKKDLNEDDDER